MKIPGDGKGPRLNQENGTSFEETMILGTRPDSGALIIDTIRERSQHPRDERSADVPFVHGRDTGLDALSQKESGVGVDTRKNG